MKDAAAQLEAIKRNRQWLTGPGIALVALGILAASAPLITGVAIEILVGSLILVAGVVRILRASKAKSWGGGLLNLITGSVSALCGILMLGHPLFGLGFLTLVLIGFFMVEDFSKLYFSLRLRPKRGWASAFFEGIVAILFGIFILMRWPSSERWTIGLLVGCDIILGGYLMLMVGLSGRSTINKAGGAAGDLIPET